MGNKANSGLPKGVTKKKYDLSGFRVYRTDADIDAAHGKVTREFEAYVRGSDMEKAIEHYTGIGYEFTNKAARDPRYANMTTAQMLQDLKQRAAAGEISERTYLELMRIHRALNHGEVPEAFTAYRGSSAKLLFGDSDYHSFEEFKALVGTTVRDMGNMSVSMIKGREFDGSVHYEVHIPAGKGIGANIMGISNLKKSEGEFLLNNGAYFRVKSVSKDTDGSPYVILEYIGRG